MPLVTRAIGAQVFLNGTTHFEGGAGIPLHTHNCPESAAILEGSAIVEIDGTEHHLERFDTTYVDAGTPHRFRNASATEPMRIPRMYASVEATRTIVETGVDEPGRRRTHESFEIGLNTKVSQGSPFSTAETEWFSRFIIPFPRKGELRCAPFRHRPAGRHPARHRRRDHDRRRRRRGSRTRGPTARSPCPARGPHRETSRSLQEDRRHPHHRQVRLAVPPGEIKKLAERYVYGEKPAKPASVTGTVSNTEITVNVTENGRSASFSAGVDCRAGPARSRPSWCSADSARTPPPSRPPALPSSPTTPSRSARKAPPRNNKQGAFYSIYGSIEHHRAAGGLGLGGEPDHRRHRAVGRQILKADATGVTGCSRYGKGAFAIGVFDQRIALTMPIESGTPVCRSCAGSPARAVAAAEQRLRGAAVVR